MPRIESPTALFVKNAKLRPDSEIKAFNNSTYEMHWSVRDAYLNGREPPDDLHPVVVYQRHRAAKKFKLRAEQIQTLTDCDGGCFATDHITVDGRRVGYMYREEPEGDWDTG